MSDRSVEEIIGSEATTVDDLLVWLLRQPCCKHDDPYNTAIEVFVRPLRPSGRFTIRLEDQDSNVRHFNGTSLLGVLETAVQAVAR